MSFFHDPKPVTPKPPKIIRKSEFIGVGALLQLVGVVALFVFPIGTIAGVILIVLGSRLSFKYRCSECGNKVEKTTKICPHPNCGARF